ncbi:hypothetical protein C0Q70_10513 [Pomacea canaliculata]|uniref:Kinetochore protein NDC80 n=2 Tax=Pomacea canaliculata TaxID=400727 RepID=A0A2T7P3D7_POMCA|nr:kinetochore protein NDC80 homolog isoform X2 [Pomacea canaliculata]PVD27937.1 hypothetical protein C0Q70_10513 [Pomacea canaliculata]
MRKSSFGQFGGRLSSGPLRVKNENGSTNIRKSTTGSRTPQGKMFPVTLQPKIRPSTAVRNSSIGFYNSGLGTRGSSIGIRGRVDVPKDPRPISDRGFQQKCIRQLIDFLVENKYPHPISQKVLHSPPSKEFFRIFEFIYQFLDRSYKLTGKMEDEVLRLLKVLGYPFTISKSSMYAVGTPHTWPHLLVALIWLTDLVKYSQSMADTTLLDRHIIFTPEDADFDSLPDDKILFEYVTQTYAAYLSGEDSYDAFDEELSKLLEDKYLGQSGGIEAIQSESSRISEEIALLDQELSRVNKLREHQEIMLLDEQKYRDYLREVEAVQRKHQQLLIDAQEQSVLLAEELQSVHQKIQHMQVIYEQQELTPADVERLKAARLDLQRQEEALEREVKDLSSEIWKKEIAYGRLHEQLNSSIAEYSKLARAHKLIPVTAENANGIDFELHVSYQESESNNFDSIIKPALMAIKKQTMDKLHHAETCKLQEERNLEQFQESISESEQALAELEKEIKKIDEELECRKQLYQRDIDGLQAAVDNIQAEIRTFQTSSQLSLQDAEKDLRDTVSWADREKAALIKKEQEYSRFMCNACTLVSDHKTHMHQRLMELEKEVKQVLLQTQHRTRIMEENSLKLRSEL